MAGPAIAAAAWALLLALGTAACSTSPLHLINPGSAARDMADDAGWRELRLSTSHFDLAAFAPAATAAGGPLHVYVEGDGRAYGPRGAARDPTPVRSTGLSLALADPAPAALYLARPCQYVAAAERRNCDAAYWTTARFHENVVASMNEAIDAHLAALGAPAPAIRLIGYSGGGAVAALIAARRDDVAGLITVAAPLNHAAWTSHHRITPLYDSLNPADAAGLARVPQIHIAGAEDRIVPPTVIAPLVEALRARGAPRAAMVTVAEADHDCCWAALWPGLLARALQRLEAGNTGG